MAQSDGSGKFLHRLSNRLSEKTVYIHILWEVVIYCYTLDQSWLGRRTVVCADQLGPQGHIRRAGAGESDVFVRYMCQALGIDLVTCETLKQRNPNNDGIGATCIPAPPWSRKAP
jgi:hypothetical protein